MKAFENLKAIHRESVPVKVLIESPAEIQLICGEEFLENKIISKNLYRPQLVLAGYAGLFSYKQIQIFGNTEYYYLKGLETDKRKEAFESLCHFEIPCIIMTNNHNLDDELKEVAMNEGIPIFRTPYTTSKTTYVLHEFLNDLFAFQATIHGSFVDVYGVGILFIGRSGIGKSEIALDLIERGHRLVADDIVIISKKNETTLMGTGTHLVQHFMEIRGLGMLDISRMFGIRSIRFQKRLEIIVELEEWDDEKEYTRTGMDDEKCDILGVELANIKLPIFSGKNITVIAEVIATNYLLKTYGYIAAEVFAERLTQAIKNKTGNYRDDQRMINYFQGDIE